MSAQTTFHGIDVQDRTVVAIDATDVSAAVLHWAVRNNRSQSPPVVVYVWEFPPLFGVAGNPSPERMRTSEQYQEAEKGARALLEKTVHEALGEDGLSTEQLLVEDRSPGRALIELGGQAAILVLGSKHKPHHLAGSGGVLTYCLRHQNCPIAVVPSG